MIPNLTTWLNNRVDKEHASMAMMVAFALLLAMLSYSALYQWTSDWQLTHQKALKAIPVSTDDADRLIAALPNAHLFGRSLDGKDAPLSSLQMRLTGISKGREQASATISLSGQPGKIYRIGDMLPYGVKINDITEEAVILENDGQLEKLTLPREKLNFKPLEPIDWESRS